LDAGDLIAGKNNAIFRALRQIEWDRRRPTACECAKDASDLKVGRRA
jgi:hypothetical protein